VVVTDDLSGIKDTVTEAYLKADEQQCVLQKTGSIRSKIREITKTISYATSRVGTMLRRSFKPRRVFPTSRQNGTKYIPKEMRRRNETQEGFPSPKSAVKDFTLETRSRNDKWGNRRMRGCRKQSLNYRKSLRTVMVQKKGNNTRSR